MFERHPGESPGEEISPEIQLTPEIAEKISEKAIDIDAKGHGYTVLSAFSLGGGGTENLESVLKNGLLGTGSDYKEASILGGSPTKESWARHARTKEETNFYFNITGRGHLSFAHPGPKLDIKNSEHFGYEGESTALLFDLSSFHEETPSAEPFIPGTKKFKVDDPLFNHGLAGIPAGWFDENDLPKPDTKYGFIGSRRVAPRFFKALVYKFRTPRKFLEAIRWNKIQREILNEMGQTILSSFSIPENGIPIYDQNGNMMWPKQISYKEILEKLNEKGGVNKPSK